MKLPILEPLRQSIEKIDIFGGYNRNARIGENEFHDMERMCGDKFPVLSTSGKYGQFEYFDEETNMNSATTASQIVRAETLWFCTGSNVAESNGWVPLDGVNFKRIPHAKFPFATERESVVSMGGYLINGTTRNYASIYDEKDHGSLDFKLSYNTAAFYPCDSNFKNIAPATSKPSSPTDGEYWLDSSGDEDVLKYYDSASGSWLIAHVSYTALMITDVNDVDYYASEELYNGEGGSIYIYIRNKDGTDATIEDEQLKDIVSTKEEKRAIIIRGYRNNPSFPFIKDIILEAVMFNQVLYYAENYDIVVERKSPKMDYVVECNNRLWGCKYGMGENGKIINEIYASKLGDFKNWWVYQGVSTDSYAATIGRGGKFTGACVYKGRPIFFKEDCMIIVYGDYPAQYQLQYVDCLGVRHGSQRSIAVVGDTLFYHSVAGVCAYNGTVPQLISGAFGDVKYRDAVGCGFEDKYYFSAYNVERVPTGDGKFTQEPVFFCFDTKRGIWYKEGKVYVSAMQSFDGDMYFAEPWVYTLKSGGEENPNDIEWLLESGNLGTNLDERKYISKVSLRVKTEPSAKINVYVQYDGDGVWRFVQTIASRNLSAVTFHLPIRRCDHFKIKMVGTGYCEIHSITKYIRQGSLKK